MKRSLQSSALLSGATALIAATYGLVRLGYGLFLPDVQRDLRLPVEVAGLVASGGSAAYCVAAVLAFLIAERRPRPVAASAGLLAAAGSAGMAAAAHPAVFAAAAVAGSAGAGLASPAVVALVRRNVAPARQDAAQTVANAGTGPGLVVAGVLALLVLPDWRTAWWLIAVTTVVVTAVVLLADHPRHEAPDASAGTPVPWRLLGTPAAGAVLLGVGSAGVWVHGRSFLDAASEPGSPVSVVAWIALGVGGVLAAASGAVLARGVRGAWTVTVVPVALASLALALAPGTPWLSVAACAVFGWGYTAASSVLVVWASRVAPHAAARGTSVLFVALVLGQALGSALTGALLARAPGPLGLVVAAGVALLSAAPALVRDAPARPADVRPEPVGR
ncbi:MFS transporter [Umezawaea beigongshangensis]|uniref:MFS transporter n=1 Tax=Umezawaea beigongshangensis TaxID=2780383 RepID=UPI0018F1D302|nr:MFS transporter [Umezawaea beigongshangensis]